MTVITEENMFLAKRLFPGLARSESGGDPAYYEEKYPARDLPDGAAVTRLGPSPTGFIHLGNLYTAIVNQKLANETGGIFLLRVEDTDSKREMAGAVESLIASLSHYGVVFDEGVMLDALVGGVVEQGGYGPYHQSARRDIYHTFAKRLVEEGKAYPCFLTEEEIDGIRIRQEAAKLTPGIYGQWAKYRSLTAAEYGQMLERGLPYVLRFRAPQEERRISVRDGIRGEVHAPGNTMDFVLLKSDGMPTYHFAHVVDDHLMRTTHVIRGEEWLSSLPVHVDLFEALGFELPIYCHSAVL
ncbi:MAG: glutamate--tRNA ligase, partial [Clostridiales Family XIII bacterium]|nr:glutamate--tRNA ligase [Clostridiales Family XIII bacterium]